MAIVRTFRSEEIYDPHRILLHIRDKERGHWRDSKGFW